MSDVVKLRKSLVQLVQDLRAVVVEVERAEALEASSPGEAMSAARAAQKAWKSFCRAAGPQQAAIANLHTLVQTHRLIDTSTYSTHVRWGDHSQNGGPGYVAPCQFHGTAHMSLYGVCEQCEQEKRG